MKIMKATAMVAVALAALAGPSIGAGPAAVGYNKLAVPAKSDVLVSVPFAKGNLGTFTVSGDPNAADGIAVSGAPFTAGELNGMYFVQVLNGDAKGRWATIASNTTTNLVLADNHFIADLADGDEIRVLKHQTLGGLFPASLKGFSFLASPSPATRVTEILIPDAGGTGVNKAPAATYYYSNGAWRKFPGLPTQSFDQTVLAPDSYVIIRNNSDEELTFLAGGTVLSEAVSQVVPVKTLANDVVITTGRPVPVKLKDLQLGGTAAFESSPSPAAIKDQLLVFDNAATGTNKAPVATYYYSNGAWRKFPGNPAQSFDSTELPAGAALLIRKAAGTEQTVTWTQSLPY
jgi:uncharacterized protein (TIGR02597 family)